MNLRRSSVLVWALLGGSLELVMLGACVGSTGFGNGGRGLKQILDNEVGPKAKSQLDLNGPVIHFAQLGQSMGVHSVRASTADEFVRALEYALATPGPDLIEAVVPQSLSSVKRRVLPWLLRSLPNLPPGVARALKHKIAP